MIVLALMSPIVKTPAPTPVEGGVMTSSSNSTAMLGGNFQLHKANFWVAHYVCCRT